MSLFLLDYGGDYRKKLIDCVVNQTIFSRRGFGKELLEPDNVDGLMAKTKDDRWTSDLKDNVAIRPFFGDQPKYLVPSLDDRSEE